ncbi:MAG: alpha/beta hydrolase [Hyphomicrobiales bacterium]|nr:alpha/beta hydrolase [Hyphomicrobiales bacterium]
MELILTPDNPVPPDANVSSIRAIDAMTLRVARWHPPGRSRGTVVICQGRAEFIEKYFETASDLLSRGLTVVAFDWRGQGLSGRELDNSRKGHIDDFSLYERDLDCILEQVLMPFCPQPWFALAHSMGAAVALRQARSGRTPFERLVLTAPMIDIHNLRYPSLARAAAKLLDLAGLGSAFIPGGGETALLTKPFRDNPLTFDAQRYERNNNIVAAAPHVAIGDPTIGWVDAAFAQIEEFANPEYPRRVLTPILVFAAANDRVVDGVALERFATRLKAGRLVTLARARHEILAESDDVRDQFWAAFDAFIPGTRDEYDALVTAQRTIESVRQK